MSFPDGLTQVSVHGLLNADNGEAEFTSRQPLIGAADNAIVAPFTIAAAFDSGGEFTVSLPSTNDPGWSPQGWAYTVRITAGGVSFRGTLQLDYQTTSVELADLLQVDGAAEQGVSYILAAQRGVAGGVAGLDADGDVIDATGAKVTGGSGGGAAPGSTVVSETSYGQSATAGTGTAYSRATHSHGTPAAPAAADISDATTVGKAVLTAADQAAALTAIGAETSGAAATAQTTAEAYADSAVATHAADTTSVHGITDTSALVVTTDTRLSDARTPTAHASTHADGGSDEIAVDASQVTTGTLATARGGTGLASFTSGNFVTATSTSALATSKAVPTGAVVGTTDAQTLTNKTLTAPAISSPTGLAKADVGLGNVDNTADADKPVSTATQTALDAKVDTADYPGLIVLGPTDDVPSGTATGTVIVRTAT